MEKKICLSIEQMQKLKELGIEPKDASMCWIRDGEGNATAELHDEFCYEMSFMKPMPAFTLENILEMMPSSIRNKYLSIDTRQFFLKMEKFENRYKFFYYHFSFDPMIATPYYENAIDAAFELLCWLAENKLLKQ
ncbi:hypothetical protein [Parabacteroides pacaensis]|uniref:hypothetical protein n=1 Tax=Parabacteroides pacaensis TaxID=2086575 RepID=UPI000D112266|nr:hypothetical protein [Parabacteroides pacaensis]